MRSANPVSETTPELTGIDALVTSDVPVFRPGSSAAEVRRALARTTYDSVDDVVVCTELDGIRVLRGLVPVGRLLTAQDATPLHELMDADPPVVVRGLDAEQAAWKAVRHGESSLAVTAPGGAFLGVVPPARLLESLLRGHDQDFARLGGYLASSSRARHAVEEPVGRRLWHRTPWLLLGLVGAAVSAWMVGLFGGRLEGDVRLAFFIPGVVYMADAVGTQTEALVIRGLSVGAPMRTAFRLELLTGPCTGVLFALLATPLVWWVLGSLPVALTVGLALFAACSLATAIAVLLPWLMHQQGVDPAFGSGPLATVVQDLASLAIYLGCALLLLG